MDQSGEGTERLIARWLHEDPQRGFTALLDHYGGRVSGYLRRRFPSLGPDDVCDALADAMLVLAGTFDPSRGSLAAWFLFLAHQQAVTAIRAQRRRRESRQLDDVPEPAVAAPHGLEQLLAEERLVRVREALAVLSDLERSVIEADLGAQRVVAADELAAQLNTTAGSVYSARRRARRKLQERCDWLRDIVEEKRNDHDEAT